MSFGCDFGQIEPFVINELKIDDIIIDNKYKLSDEQFMKDEEVIASFPSIEKMDVCRTTLVERKVEVTGKPVKQRYYPLKPAKRQDKSKNVLGVNGVHHLWYITAMYECQKTE